jgi:hypothetical protein
MSGKKKKKKKKSLVLYTTLHTIKTPEVLLSTAKQVNYNGFTDVQQGAAQVRVQKRSALQWHLTNMLQRITLTGLIYQQVAKLYTITSEGKLYYAFS